MMTRMFEPQLGKSIEAYIDDIVVKSKVAFEHVRDFGDIFEILRRHKLRLNAYKSSFGVGFNWKCFIFRVFVFLVQGSITTHF